MFVKEMCLGCDDIDANNSIDVLDEWLKGKSN